jgi:hypothetical protein
MPDKRTRPSQSLPVANYSSAIARALEWLGDRYLLAKPINAAPIRESRAFARSRPVVDESLSRNGAAQATLAAQTARLIL